MQMKTALVFAVLGFVVILVLAALLIVLPAPEYDDSISLPVVVQ